MTLVLHLLYFGFAATVGSFGEPVMAQGFLAGHALVGV
jgi:hypothetical protein